MESWIEFWKWTYVIMLGLFYLIVLVVIPLGIRDLVRLFRMLRQDREESE